MLAGEKQVHIIRRSQAGDEEAFTRLFQQYKNLVYKTAFFMLDDAVKAEDALQEVFIRVHRSLHTFDPNKGAFTTWLHRITVNYCLNHRRKRRLSSVPLDEVAVTLPGAPSPSMTAQEEAVRQAVSGLSDKQRAVVVLRYYWELPYAEIAQILSIPLGTVKSRLNLALRTLHRELEQSAEQASSQDHLRKERFADEMSQSE